MDRYAFLKANGERVGAVVAAVVGLLALLLGWIGVSGADLTTKQVPYIISGAVFGLFALGVAGTLWIGAALRAEWQKLDDIYVLLADDAPESPTP